MEYKEVERLPRAMGVSRVNVGGDVDRMNRSNCYRRLMRSMYLCDPHVHNAIARSRSVLCRRGATAAVNASRTVTIARVYREPSERDRS